MRDIPATLMLLVAVYSVLFLLTFGFYLILGGDPLTIINWIAK